MKARLDKYLSDTGLVATRSKAESFIKLGEVKVNGKVVTKPGFMVAQTDKVDLLIKQQYVSRAGLKLASVAEIFRLNFKGKVVLDQFMSDFLFTPKNEPH